MKGRLPATSIEVTDQLMARSTANWLWGVGKMLGGSSLLGAAISHAAASEFETGWMVTTLFLACCAGAIPLLMSAIFLRYLDAMGGWSSWRADKRAIRATAEVIGHAPTPVQVLRRQLEEQRSDQGMLPQTIHRFLAARGTSPPVDRLERDYLRGLLVYMVKLSWTIKAELRDQSSREEANVNRREITLLGQKYEPMNLDKACREVSERLTRLLEAAEATIDGEATPVHTLYASTQPRRVLGPPQRAPLGQGLSEQYSAPVEH